MLFVGFLSLEPFHPLRHPKIGSMFTLKRARLVKAGAQVKARVEGFDHDFKADKSSVRPVRRLTRAG